MPKASLTSAETRELSTGLTANEAHELLASDRRRLILDVLDGRTTSLDLDELAVEVAAHEDGSDPADQNTLQQLRILLHHNHLPKMDEFGVLDYDPTSHCVQP